MFIVYVGFLVSFKGSVIVNFVELKVIVVFFIWVFLMDNMINVLYDFLGLNFYI